MYLAMQLLFSFCTQADFPEGSLSLFNKGTNERHSFERYKSTISLPNISVKVIFLLQNVLALGLHVFKVTSNLRGYPPEKEIVRALFSTEKL